MEWTARARVFVASSFRRRLISLFALAPSVCVAARVPTRQMDDAVLHAPLWVSAQPPPFPSGLASLASPPFLRQEH